MVYFFIEIIIAALVGAMAAGALGYLAIMRMREINRISLIAQVEITSEATLESAIYQTCADRALVIKLHNGGGKIYAGTNKYITVLHEAHTQRIPGAKKDYQRFFADVNYMKMMAELEEKRIIKTKVSDLEYGLLRRRYEADGITASIVFWIKETEGGLYYGSFTTTNDPDLLLKRDFSKLETKINRLRNKYETAHRRGVLH